MSATEEARKTINAWVEKETQDKITVGNASRVYNFTPADPATITGA